MSGSSQGQQNKRGGACSVCVCVGGGDVVSGLLACPTSGCGREVGRGSVVRARISSASMLLMSHGITGGTPCREILTKPYTLNTMIALVYKAPPRGAHKILNPNETAH